MPAPVVPIADAPSVAREASRRTVSGRRFALGLSPTPRPVLGVLLFGIVLGPHGLGLLPQSAFSALDPPVSAALAALGALVGLDLKIRRPREDRLLKAASLEAGITFLVVCLGVLAIHSLSSASGPRPWVLALMLGICASPSSTRAIASADLSDWTRSRVGDLDDLLPILLGAIGVAWVHEEPAAALWLVAQSGLIALAIAAAVWLLATEAPSESEQRVFVIGGLLLLGGAAAYVSGSALFAGLVAGAFWNAVGPPALDDLARDIRYFQHPLVVLLLLVAGARLEPRMDLVGLAAAYVVFRVVGKLAGGWLASSTVARDLPRSLGFSLMSPGVLGMAFALNVLQTPGIDGAGILFTIVIVGSLGAELLSVIPSLARRPS